MEQSEDHGNACVLHDDVGFDVFVYLHLKNPRFGHYAGTGFLYKKSKRETVFIVYYLLSIHKNKVFFRLKYEWNILLLCYNIIMSKGKRGENTGRENI